MSLPVLILPGGKRVTTCEIGPGHFIGGWRRGSGRRADEREMASLSKKIFSFLALIISDLAVVFLSFGLSYLIRSLFFPHFLADLKAIRQLLPFSIFIDHYYFAFVWIAIFAYEKLYTKRLPFWEEVWILWKASSISFLLIMVAIFISRRQIQFSRIIIVLAWFLTLFLFPLFRYFVKKLLIHIHVWRKNLIILGANETGSLVLKNIRKNDTLGYHIVGFLDDGPDRIGQKFHGLDIIGTIADLEKVIKVGNSKDIIIALPDYSREKLVELLQICERSSESLWLIPRTGDIITTAMEKETLGEILALNIKKNLEKPWNVLVKNVFDKTVTLILLIFSLPLFLIIAAALKRDSKGPVFFGQKRLGLGKKEFLLLKFRSMYEDADSRLGGYLKNNPTAREEWEKYKKLKSYDPRVTRVGRIIRKSSLDELPQLFNIISGKMSLVGPRPYLADELVGKESFVDRLAKAKPGITGLWQVSGRSELSFDERIALDDYYVRNWTLWLDLVILFRSIKVLFSGKGAY
jgi:Undecaprenyl-phosphate galactose phosphotransferase WbaP